MRNLYVFSAIPPNSNHLLRKYGLLSGSEVVKFPEVLKAARPKAKDQRAFEKRVKEVLASERPYSMMGPSVLFTPPDPKKITDKHFIKKWNLQSIRIDLGRLLEDYPDTIVWGAELLPYDKAWRDMSEDEFEEEMAELGYASWEDFAAERSRALTLDEVRDFTQMRPKVLWEHYSKSDAGKMYASNVPHAFIITPMGYIPYEYIEYVDEAHMRKNPQPILELRTLTDNDEDLTLICVCAETCPSELKDVDTLFFALFEMGENEHFLFEEDLTSREDIKTCIEIVEQFTTPISQLLQKLGLDDKTIIVLSAEEASEDSTLLGKRIESFKSFFENVEAHAIVVYCESLYMSLRHSEYGMRRETLITIAHELGHAYTGDIYDEDGDLVEAEDNHGPDEIEVEAFGRKWADLVLGNASEADIDALISKFKAEIERLKFAIESGEVNPYDRKRPNPHREWFETQSLQSDENGFLINPDTNDIYWYHGSKYGELGDGHVLYFSSDIDIARTMACQMFCYSEDDCTTTVYKAKLKTRAYEIFDARYADSSKNAKSLAEHLNLEHPYDEYSLGFDNFDEKLGYHAQTDTDIAYAQSLGFKGWLEVEDTTGDPEPCTIGLFTNSMINYEIVETVLLSEKECKGFY